MINGGFFFNTEKDKDKIKCYKPFQRAKNGMLTKGQKLWNTKLAEVQVVVKNAIHTIRVFKILGGIFQHWRGSKR
jgi:hypothetical protein